jgi:hypothetical protein
MLVHVSAVKFNGQSTVSAPLRALMRSIGAAPESDGGDADEKGEEETGTAPQVSVFVRLRNAAMPFLRGISLFDVTSTKVQVLTPEELLRCVTLLCRSCVALLICSDLCITRLSYA